MCNISLRGLQKEEEGRDFFSLDFEQTFSSSYLCATTREEACKGGRRDVISLNVILDLTFFKDILVLS